MGTFRATSWRTGSRVILVNSWPKLLSWPRGSACRSVTLTAGGTGWTRLSPADLIVYDTVDEAFPALHQRVSRRERILALRDLRDAARDSGKAVIATCRVAASGHSLPDVQQAWHAHRMHEAIMDAADTVITVSEAHAPCHVRLVVEDRLGRNRMVDLRMDSRTGRSSTRHD